MASDYLLKLVGIGLLVTLVIFLFIASVKDVLGNKNSKGPKDKK